MKFNWGLHQKNNQLNFALTFYKRAAFQCKVTFYLSHRVRLRSSTLLCNRGIVQLYLWMKEEFRFTKFLWTEFTSYEQAILQIPKIQQAEITMWWKSMLKCAITIHQQHVLVNLLISRLYAIWDLALNSPFWFFSREKYIMVIWCSLNLPEDILSNQSLWERYESGVGLLLFSFPSSSINILN